MGRKKRGNVLWAKRVTPEVAEKLEVWVPQLMYGTNGLSQAVPLDSKPFAGPDHTKVLETENKVLKMEINSLRNKLKEAENKLKPYEDYSQ
jgi:hypothetical protein